MHQSDLAFRNVEEGIYKFLSDPENRGIVQIAPFLKELKVRFPINWRSTYSTSGLFKASIFMFLKGLKSPKALVGYLKAHESEAMALGFYHGIPSRRLFSHFLAKDEMWELVDFTVKKTEEIADKFGIVLDREVLKKPQASDRKCNSYETKKKIGEVCKLTKRKIYPHIKLDIRHNSIYNKRNFLDLLVHVGITNDFAENGSKTLNQRSRSPSADAFLYHVKKYKSIEEIKQTFCKAFDVIWRLAKAGEIFKDRKPVDVAIDFHDWHFYGDRNAPMVVETKPDRGTSRCYKFATIDIVERGKRFTLLALPVGTFDNKEKIVEELLSFAMKKVRIRYVYMDRGFFSGRMINLLERMCLKFLMPATKNRRVAEQMQTLPAPTIIKGYEMGDKETRTSFNLVIVEENRQKYAFATNISFDEKEADLANRLFGLYGKRWGIETGYRVKKHSIRAKTTSKNYMVRLFYFLFSVMLYNLWVIVNVLIKRGLGKMSEKYELTAKLFGTILLRIADT